MSARRTVTPNGISIYSTEPYRDSVRPLVNMHTSGLGVKADILTKNTKLGRLSSAATIRNRNENLNRKFTAVSPFCSFLYLFKLAF